jgi:thioredoxin-related protein
MIKKLVRLLFFCFFLVQGLHAQVPDSLQFILKDSLISRPDTAAVFSDFESIEKFNAGESRRKVFIFIDSANCLDCRRTETESFVNPLIQKLLSENFYAAKLNFRTENDISFRENIFRFVPNENGGMHELPAALMQGNLTLPCCVFLDEDFRIIYTYNGFLAPKTAEALLHFVAENHYTETDADSFVKNYSGELK